MSQYEVEKFARGNNGEWFGFGARRFASESAARAYLARFAEDQAPVLTNGIRIDLRLRAGRRVLATVGGLLDRVAAKQIREVQS